MEQIHLKNKPCMERIENYGKIRFSMEKLWNLIFPLKKVVKRKVLFRKTKKNPIRNLVGRSIFYGQSCGTYYFL